MIAFSYAILQEFLSTPSARRATTKPYTRSIIDAISIHALREEGDFSFFVLLFFCFLFLSTPSARRATGRACCFQPVSSYFYPRPPRGGRQAAAPEAIQPEEFLSTPSARRATHHSLTGGTTMADFYPRPPRGGRLCAARAFNSTLLFLSTPSARRATSRQRMPSASWQFLSTPSARRATPSRASRWLSSTTFLSTPSARRATGGKYKDMIAARIFLSTPSARRATRLRRGWVRRRTISIHALREEGDMARARMRSTSWNFYPRPPRGGRRWQLFGSQHKRPISIHALREEGDHLRPGWFRPIRYFYPRPPRGGRPGSSQRMPAASFDFYPRPPRGGRHGPCKDALDKLEFLSTPSARRATAPVWRGSRVIRFLSTPSARRATKALKKQIPAKVFLSTPSARRATHGAAVLDIVQLDFYPRPPRGGRHPYGISAWHYRSHFYPRPPRGGRLILRVYGFVNLTFLSTPSARRATSPSGA